MKRSITFCTSTTHSRLAFLGYVVVLLLTACANHIANNSNNHNFNPMKMKRMNLPTAAITTRPPTTPGKLPTPSASPCLKREPPRLSTERTSTSTSPPPPRATFLLPTRRTPPTFPPKAKVRTYSHSIRIKQSAVSCSYP